MAYNIWGTTEAPTARYRVTVFYEPECEDYRCCITIGRTPLSVQYATSRVGAVQLAAKVVRGRRKLGQLKQLRGA